MQLIPAIDLKGGIVVRGVGGRRAEYRPIQSRLTASIEPVDIANAFRNEYGLSRIYLADLDAITGLPPSFDRYRQLANEGFDLVVDAGIRTAADGLILARGNISTPVVATETLNSPTELVRLLETADPDKLLVSVDLKSGKSLANAAWPADVHELIDVVVELGVRRLLLLDLADVGSGNGVGTVALASRVRSKYPLVEIWCGGGLRNQGDAMRLAALGIDAVLVSSALHDRRIAADTVRRGFA